MSGVQIPDPTGKPYLVKLVRDRVGEKPAQSTVTYEPIEDRSEYVVKLRQKLIEEAIEYLQDPSVAELADVLEVVKELAESDQATSLDAVFQAADRKFAERGGFHLGVGMYATTTTPHGQLDAEAPDA